ncbi:TonB-dependent receptor [uncultured Pontibacter sp.]|uniref:SusC/RagA family TonB-linked outer membrane protein n=1 Tax=uncultured Pontibacter sp. TaxID=453356 RepID=UPI00261C40F1|nr:TonB-dependent receptor [uncultured Pontibacter sp.]
MKKVLLLNFLFLFALLGQVVAQSRTITGKVTGAGDGSPLPGVSVVVKGTSTGTATSADGTFSVNVPGDANTLVFRYIGYITKEVAVGAGNNIDVALQLDNKQLSEVVITGYTEQAVEKITGSVSTVNSKSIEQVPIATFDQILQGRAPGLQVSAGSGQPGSTARVRIRGNGSISSSNDPLYIMDGVPIDANVFATINPNDIASVNILKDAASTSLYGSRAANGVIVITTKRGTAGKTTFTYRGMQGYSTPTRAEFNQMNTTEKIEYETFLASKGMYRGTVGGWYSRNNLAPTHANYLSIDQINSLKEGLSENNEDWQKVFFRNGKTQSHEVNASGGDAKTRFYISGAYFNQEGIMLRSDLERYTTRINIDHDTQNRFRFGVNASAGYSEQASIESEGAAALANPVLAVYLANPYDLLRDPETGEINTVTTNVGGRAFDRIQATTNDRKELKAVTSAYAEFDILKELKLRNVTGVDYRTREFDRLIQPNTIPGDASVGKKGSLNQASNRRTKFISTTTLNYKKALGERHFIDLLAGGEVNKETFKSTTYTGYGLNDKIWTPAGITQGNADMIPVVGGTNSESALISSFFNGNYTLDGKYNLSAGIRRDGSSRFGANNRYATFWSVGASWNISEENFMQNFGALDNLKLRASYGTSGNQEGIGDFERLGQFSIVSYNGQQGIAPNPSTPDNPDLKWEVLNSANVGLDFSFLNRRISGTFDVYNNITSDLFISTQLSRTSGFTTLQRNAGKMRNRGIEVGLNADVIRSNDFVWNLGVNYGYNDNEILDLMQVEEFEAGTSIIRKGLPLGTHYIPSYAGVNPANGDPLYLDANGGITNDYGQAVYNTHGTFNPPHTGGFNSNMSYKRLELAAFFSFVQGNQLFNNNTFFFTNPASFAGYNQDARLLNAWKQPGDVTEFARWDAPRQFSSQDLEDASYLRLRNLTLAYSLPSALTQKAFISNARVFLQGQNLFTVTNYTGFDPEDDNNIQMAQYPMPRTYTVGVDVTF